MPKLTYIAALLLLGPASAWGQQAITWQQLSGVSYAYVERSHQTIWYGAPSFAPEVQALDGKLVQISGYVLPAAFEDGFYYLSANPFNTCFFCGGAGQESVIELRLRNPKEKYRTDEWATFTGVLRLNSRELEITYILEDARRR